MHCFLGSKRMSKQKRGPTPYADSKVQRIMRIAMHRLAGVT